jgi:hypothetical protein
MFYIRNYRNTILSFRIHLKLGALAAVVALLAFWSGNVSAQTSADGTIHGRIADTSGAALVGVNIVAHSSAVGGSFKAESDSEGNYRLTDLPPGTDYVVEAGTAGFEKFVSDEARLAWSYALTVSRTHSSMRLSSSASTSWLANSSESCWARLR